MAVKSVVTFEAEFAQNAVETNSDVPAGRGVTEFLREGLASAGFTPSGVQQHDSYGWYFEVPVAGGRIWCMLQRSDNWLLITRPTLPLLKKFLGKVPEREHQRVCEVIDSILQRASGVRDVHWYTMTEFESKTAGSSHP